MKCDKCHQEIISQSGIIKIPELGIEVEVEVHDKGRRLCDIKITEGWRLLSVCREEDKVNEVVWLANSKYAKALKMDTSSNNDDFFIEQPFNKNEQKNYSARFGANSGWAVLGCGGNPRYSDPTLGVRFCRDLRKVKK